MMGGTVVAVDGTKIEAVASRKAVITSKSLKATFDRLDRNQAGDHHPDVEALLAALQPRPA